MTDRDWLDGPAFVQWLKDRGMRGDDQFGPSIARAVRGWRKGRRAKFTSADEVLVRLGYHLHDLPDDMWVEGDGLGRRAYSDDFKKMVCREHTEGIPVTWLARRYKVPYGTVSAWVREDSA